MLDGAKIKDKLTAKGISAAQLAERVGVSKGMMSFIISGKRDTSVAVACRIATFLGCRVDDLLKSTN